MIYNEWINACNATLNFGYRNGHSRHLPRLNYGCKIECLHLGWRKREFVTMFHLYIYIYIFKDEIVFSSLNVVIWWRNNFSSLDFGTIGHVCCSEFLRLVFYFVFKNHYIKVHISSPCSKIPKFYVISHEWSRLIYFTLLVAMLLLCHLIVRISLSFSPIFLFCFTLLIFLNFNLLRMQNI